MVRPPKRPDGSPADDGSLRRLSDVRPAMRLIEQALEYWDGKRGSRAMPARADIDPLEIRPLLPYLMLLDVLSEPLDFRYRLVGTGIVARNLHDYTGMRITEIAHQAPPSRVWSSLSQVVETAAPLRSNVPYVGEDDRVIGLRDVMLPLSDDGRRVNMIMVVAEFHSRPGPPRDPLRGLIFRG